MAESFKDKIIINDTNTTSSSTTKELDLSLLSFSMDNNNKNNDDKDNNNEDTTAGTHTIVTTPAFVISRTQMQRNCQVVLDYAAQHGFQLRPHIKTHKTLQGALLQAGYSSSFSSSSSSSSHPTFAKHVVGFVVSTLPELELLLGSASSLRYRGDNDNNNNDDNKQSSHCPLENVLLGVPISSSKLSRIHQLYSTHQISKCIRFLVDHPQHLKLLQQTLRSKKSQHQHDNNNNDNDNLMPVIKYKVYIKLDTGYHRAGVPCYSDNDDDDMAAAVAFAMQIVNEYKHELELEGVYSHCGHAYNLSRDRFEEHEALAENDLRHIASFLKAFKRKLKQNAGSNNDGANASAATTTLSWVDSLVVSVGSTPSLFHLRTPGTTRMIPNPIELHPGNYVFYDRQQEWTGAAVRTDDHDHDDEHHASSAVACRVLATVISHYPDRQTILLDAGALALSKDGMPTNDLENNNSSTTCSIARRPDLECFKTSQEVTLVRPVANIRASLGQQQPLTSLDDDFFPAIGQMVWLVPNHSCLSAACFHKYYIVDSFVPYENNTRTTNRRPPPPKVVDIWMPVKFF